jgi:ABC-2 type transport system permease protein
MIAPTLAEMWADFRLSESLRRIGAMLLRHLYLMRSSWTRVFDLMYWPVLQLLIWGFLTTYLATSSSPLMRAGGLLIGAALLWDVLVRGQFGMTLSLLEEMWSRNFANLFVTPLRPTEFACALMGMSFIRSLIGVLPASFVAIPLFAYSIYTLGLPLLAFYWMLLMFSWAVGLIICAMLVRFGLAAESFAWASIFVLAPLSGVYYPVSVLPWWLQPVAWALPSTHVFEGMRAVMFGQGFDVGLFFSALGLNLVYIALGFAVFLYAFRVARRRGQLMGSGE